MAWARCSTPSVTLGSADWRSDTRDHYFRARLPEQFDAVLHIDQTTALEPLERWAFDEVDLPETYPSGI